MTNPFSDETPEQPIKTVSTHFCLVCGFETQDEAVAYDHDCMKRIGGD